ncbi:hypothetical protein [Mesorhizobium sp. WSM2239]|uniref:Uncharacterized protein n=2 Tax=unclassified Mesorhizobium TaxID=325217 RepID=A0AAU8D289_9HYPH
MKIIHAHCESDWEGLYIDGICVAQEHSLRLGSILELIKDRGQPIAEYEPKWVDPDWMDEQGYLPEDIKEVQWSK